MKKFSLLSVVFVLLLAGCSGLSLSSEPDIVRELPLPTAAPESTLPQVAPDLVAGAAFFAEHCQMCHGISGQGDGEMVQDGRLQSPPPDFTDFATAWDNSPQEYLQAVTDGNVLAGMPPFASYSVAERWNAAAYVYSGAFSADVLAEGQALYDANCASCHGPQGAGDGPDAAEIMPDLADLTNWAEVSNADLFSVTASGVPQAMPAFAETLSENEIRAVVAYTRTFAATGTPGFVVPEDGGEVVAEGGAPDPVATEEVAEVADGSGDATAVPAEAADEPQVITVTGTVTNGTPEGELPEGATITLHMFDPPEYVETTLDGTLDSDGTYRFEDVNHVAGRVYLLSLKHGDVFFSSTVYQLEDPANPTLDTTLEIYDITHDAAVLQLEAGVMRITFSALGMEVAEVLSIHNTSDRVYLSEEVISENQRVALRLPLPPGATGVAFEPGLQDTRFFLSEDGMTILDANPVRPGADDILFTYLLPYEDGAIIEQAFEYPFTGPFHLLVEADQVTLDDALFAFNDQVDMGGSLFDAYVADLELAADAPMTFTVTGTPDAVAAANQPSASSSGMSPLVLGLLIAGVLFLGAGGFLFLLRQDAGDATEREINDLLEQIADLDNQHDQGALNHDYYQRTRADLKAQLAELMSQQRGDES